MAAQWQYLRTEGYKPADLLVWGNVTTPPVPVISLAQQMDIQVVFASRVSWTCAVRVGVEGAIIRVREGTSKPRQRFGVAYCLGLVFRSSYGEYEVTDFSGRAYQFASQLLMPKRWFHLYARHHAYKAVLLAEAFGVEKDAINARANDLGY